ncbi:uncharacterized protein LOC131255846 isoform X1 [Magnolia sinica]|uniref:uncharacterized protein LOC131255846 isoform X1 n=1 Tax=Magnolia sinica TaxID=86752 RepID=UPI002658B1BF|nr:uncharacterized protein LOC131255846 isoform X1 [Magnolia sinica]
MASSNSSSSSRDDPLSFSNPSSSPIPVSDAADSFLADQNSQIGSASGSFQNDGLLSAGGGDGGSDVEFGFLRPEFRQGPLVGTVQIYERHVFLCYKNPQVWPPHVEAAEFDRLPRLLSAAMTARKGEMKKLTRLTICEGHDGTETSNGDVLIFPDMIRYRGLTHFDVDTFVEEVLVKDTEWLPGTSETLKGSYVFVCSHGSRDRRCGVCGPALITKFKEEIDARGLQGQVSISPCSHIGGHKYAGNVIIFGPNLDGELTGHWYGYVTPNDVPVLLEQHIGRGEIVDALWRGQMGLSEEDQKKAQDLRFRLNEETNAEKSAKEFTQAVEIGSDVNETQADVVGCCQGAGNSSCCQNPSPKEKIKSNQVNGEGVKSNKVRASNSGKGPYTRKACAMPTWFESWEREDTYAAIAVAGAVVSVAIAYSCYRQLR